MRRVRKANTREEEEEEEKGGERETIQEKKFISTSDP